MTRNFGGMHPVRNSDRARAIVFLGIAFVFVFTIVAFVFLKQGEGNQTAAVVIEREGDIRMGEVLVPLKEIKSGDRLASEMFRKESRPEVGISDRAVRDFEEIKNHYARSLIIPGQPLHRDLITSIKPTSGVTARIPEGFRAVTIRVDARTSVEGFTRPGARVDVHWAHSLNGRPALSTIVENAEVLSAERMTQESAKLAENGMPIPSTITLLVNSRDAQKIQLASTSGKMSLSLRSDEDVLPIDGGEKPITIDELIRGVKTKDGSRSDGTVKINGAEWDLIDGKLVPHGGFGDSQ